MDEIMTECKLNLALAGVLVYISGGQRPPGGRIKTECKPNLPSAEVLVYIPGGESRRWMKSRPNVNQICVWPGVWFTLPAAKAADG